MLVERDLLLQPADFELPDVRRFAGRGGSAVRFRQLEAEAFQRGFEFRDVSRGCGFAGARVCQPGARRLDGVAEQPIPFGELHLLPAS